MNGEKGSKDQVLLATRALNSLIMACFKKGS